MIQETIKNKDFIDKYKTNKKSFTRKRIWDFSNSFLFICSFINKRLQSEIDVFFAELNQIPKEIRQVTASAFTQCRDKIKFKAFEDLSIILVENFYKNHSYKRLHHMRVVAIDGTVLTLPRNEETIREFGDNVLSTGKKWVKAQVSFATDVLNNICLDAGIKAYKTAENVMALEHIEKLGSNNLYLFDRGYFSRDILSQTFNSGNDFCFRVSRTACLEVMDFIASKEKDIITEINTPDGKLEVRLTKVQLSSGEEEYLLSSLTDKKEFSKQDLKRLYHLRWGIEEQYKDIKYSICIENFVGKKVNSIKQEFYGNILMYNLSMMLCKRSVDKKSNESTKKHEYKLNKRALLAKFKQSFIDIFFGDRSLGDILETLIKTISKESIPIRNGRNFERGKTIKAKRKYTRAYVSVV